MGADILGRLQTQREKKTTVDYVDSSAELPFSSSSSALELSSSESSSIAMDVGSTSPLCFWACFQACAICKNLKDVGFDSFSSSGNTKTCSERQQLVFTLGAKFAPLNIPSTIWPFSWSKRLRLLMMGFILSTLATSSEVPCSCSKVFQTSSKATR